MKKAAKYLMVIFLAFALLLGYISNTVNVQSSASPEHTGLIYARLYDADGSQCFPNQGEESVYTKYLTISVFNPPAGQAKQISDFNGRYCIGVEIIATLSDRSTIDVTLDSIFDVYRNSDGELIITVSYDGITETYIWSYRDNATWVIRFVIGQRFATSGCVTFRGIVAPILSDGRVLVPLRIVSELLRVEVEWDSATRTVIISNDGIYLYLPIGVPLPDGMGTPIIVNGRTMVPLRFISEAFGAEVEWDPINRAAYVFP